MRGMEYLSSTPKYNLLYEAFGWEIPQYIHMPPVMRDSQHKLSKRDGDAYFSDYVDKAIWSKPSSIIWRWSAGIPATTANSSPLTNWWRRSTSTVSTKRPVSST